MSRQRKPRAPYQFDDLEHLTRWLVTTKWGESVMREALYSSVGPRFYDEFVQRGIACLPESVTRPEPTYCVVELSYEGWVNVYGPRHLRAVVVQRPGSKWRSAKLASQVDEWIGLSMKLPYREVYWPVNLLAKGRHEAITVQEMCRREQEVEASLAFLSAIQKCGEADRAEFGTTPEWERIHGPRKGIQ